MPALITWWTQDINLLSPDADPHLVHEAGADLLGRWAEPHRTYHTTTHLVEVFWALEELEEAGAIAARDGALGRIGAWFHDAVYAVPDAGSNEPLSADLASETLPRLSFRDDDVATVDHLVRASERHDVPATACLEAAFHDADLWILSTTPERFDTFCAQVREEYVAVPDAAYAKGRSTILRPFLDRPRIYATDHAHAEWTPSARDNLRRELDRLS
ncbi:MAG: hypothetical protein ABI131_11635 [Nostocoides sp.]